MPVRTTTTNALSHNRIDFRLASQNITGSFSSCLCWCGHYDNDDDDDDDDKVAWKTSSCGEASGDRAVGHVAAARLVEPLAR